MEAQLERDGFAIVRGLVPDTTELLAGFDALVDQARQLSGVGDVEGSRFVVEPQPFRLHRVVWCGAAEPRLALGGDPGFLGLARRALRSDAVVQLIQQAHFKLPGDGVDFAWHQDASNRRYGTDLWTDIDGRGSFVQIALAIDRMGPENGGLRMIRGSHRLGFVADPTTGVVPDRYIDEDAGVDVILEPGDAAVFGPFTIHGSGPNRSEGPRRVFLQGYALPGANRRVYPGCGTGLAFSS